QLDPSSHRDDLQVQLIGLGELVRTFGAGLDRLRARLHPVLEQMPSRRAPAVDPAAALRKRAPHLSSTQPPLAMARPLVRAPRSPLSPVVLPPLRLASARAPSPRPRTSPDASAGPDSAPHTPIRLPTRLPAPRPDAEFRMSDQRCP